LQTARISKGKNIRLRQHKVGKIVT
jgi:hypothetical protein